MDELQILRQQLLAAKEEAERYREQAERAERDAASARPQNLEDFLQGCHVLHRKIKPVTNVADGTSGHTTDPLNRWYPQQILPWQDFQERQQRQWEFLDQDETLWTEKLYPSSANLEFIGQSIDPIGSENELRYVQRVALESNVKRLFDSIDFGSQQPADGYISFENQARFRTEDGEDRVERKTDLAINNQYARNIRADQYCIFRNSTKVPRPVVAIEYKAPHKLNIDQILTGLKSEIWPEREVIDKHDDSFDFRCKNLLAAVVTQLFSYMIDRGVQYGYISTGEAFVFGYIPDDPTSFRYSVNIPRHDYVVDQENRLERTAVAQVFAFILQALRADPPGPGWSDQARKTLKRWPVEFHDILATIPITERKSRETSEYKPSKWLSLPKQRRRYKLRSGCNDVSPRRISDEDDNRDDSPTDADTPSRPIATRTRQGTTKSSQGKSHQHGATHQQQRHAALVRTSTIERRPYCTQNCLRGLCQGLPVDTECPNAAEHGRRHLPRKKFLELLCSQIDTDRGRDADCLPLWIYGQMGALFKIRLSAYGYTLVAKGMEKALGHFTKNEYAVYRHLQSVQGTLVPVCCGVLSLHRPYFFDGVPLEYFLITSFGGQSLARMGRHPELEECIKNLEDRKNIALGKIRLLGVHHGDEAHRNLVYDSATDNLMVIDFGRSSVAERKPLGQLSPNRKMPSEHNLESNKRKMKRTA